MCLLLCAAPSFPQSPPLPGDTFLLRGGVIHTITGPVLEQGSILIRNGKIVGVGRNLSAPEGAVVIDLAGRHVYPGMIDSGAAPGLEKPSQDSSSDAREIGLFNPQLRAATAVNPASEQITAARANGVTSVVEVPEGDLLGGQLSLIHLDGSSGDAMALAASTAVYLRFPAIGTNPVPSHDHDDDDDEPTTAVDPEPVPYPLAKKAFDDKLTALRTFFADARRYRVAKLAKAPDLVRDLRFEAMLPVLEGATPLFVAATREREIRDAIAFADAQKVRIILADPYEAYKVLPLIASRHIPVVLGPTYSLPLHPDDDYDRSFTTPADLYKAGIKFSIATFSSRLSRNLPYQAAAAVPFGLPHDEAYKAVSINAAEIFGMGKRLGSLDEGKVADLIVTDGDPLETTTHITQVFIGGKPVSLETRQKQLYEKYLARP
jgi:imidazolonepropionase-like amidohydrolase